MNNKVLEILQSLKNGESKIEEALTALSRLQFHQTTELEYANLDHHRSLRHGITEVVYGESKSSGQIIGICKELSKNKQTVLITRADADKLNSIQENFPDSKLNFTARTATIHPPKPNLDFENGYVCVLAAGTSDLSVAEEAAEVCLAMQVPVKKVYDVGVAGLQRILSKLDELNSATALVVCAGMEGALPSVVGGLVGKPLIAVPTSVGYGASFGGLTALLAMMNSCAPGVTVVNIDNGFSAGFSACQIYREATKNRLAL